MRSATSSEWIKHWRTATPWLVALVPAGLVASASWYLAVSGGVISWPSLLDWIFQLWTTLCVPAGAALLAGLAADLEARAGDWRALRSRPAPPAKLYAAKLLVLVTHALLGTLLLCVLAGGAGTLLGATGENPAGALLAAGFASWVCALPLLAFQLWVATARGIGASVAVGIPGLLVAEIIGGTLLGGTGIGIGAWAFAPWAWPSRIAGQTLLLSGGGASQTEVSAAEASVCVVGALALVLTAALALAGAVWFGREEAR